MSLSEIQLLISQLPRSEQEDLLRALARELQAKTSQAPSRTPHSGLATDREEWLKKLVQLQSLTASKTLRPSQEILDELRADRI